MDLVGKGKRVRVYVNEGDAVHHKPAHLAILEYLRHHESAGATAVRAIEGFGGSGEVHTTRVVDADWKLPIVIEWVDSPERVARLLPGLKQLVVRGLITVDDTEIVLFTPLPVRDLQASMTAGDVMSTDVRTVGPDTPISTLVDALIDGAPQDAVCVVEDGAPIGIITSSDLATRGGLPVRMGLFPRLVRADLEPELQRLAEVPLTARQIMTPAPSVVHAGTPLREVAVILSRRHLQRLPVVDAAGRQIGMVRRLDVLRTVGPGFTASDPSARPVDLSASTPLVRILRTDVPIVHPDTPLSVVLQAVIATHLSCAIVVDADRRPVGVVTDAELLDRVAPALRPSALRSLMHRLPFSHPDARTLTTEQHAQAKTAAELMSVDVPVLDVESSASAAIGMVLDGRHKVVAIVDSGHRLVGIVDHADILRGVVEPLHGVATPADVRE
jgi:CBS domain-containing protein/PII-like signaling protein